jgi:hypothetical protein
MRHFIAFVFVAAILALTFEAFADPVTFGDANTARPGGVYVSLTTDDAASCSALCARDGICMAWTYRETPAHACELKAVVTPATTEEGAYSGLSARAPEFAQHMAEAIAPPAMRTTAPAASSIRASTTSAASRASAGEGLLGGPDDDAIRPRLGE